MMLPLSMRRALSTRGKAPSMWIRDFTEPPTSMAAGRAQIGPMRRA
jgi:hypothetical protein